MYQACTVVQYILYDREVWTRYVAGKHDCIYCTVRYQNWIYCKLPETVCTASIPGLGT
jgi:hypothetical protein